MPYVSSGYWVQGYVQEVETPLYALDLELATGVFTDVTSLCQRASYSRTLADVFSPLGADEALFELANEQGSLSPLLNTNLFPGRQVRFRATYSGSTYNLYRGRVRQVGVNPAQGQRTAVIEAWTDANRVARTQLRTNLIVGTRIASLFTEIMTRCSVLSFSSVALADYVDFAWYQDRDALNALNELITAGPFEAFVDGAGTFQLRARAAGIWQTNRTAVATLAEAQDLNVTVADREIINQFRLSATPRQQITTVETLSFIGQPVVLPASSAVGFFLTFYDPRNYGVPAPVGSIVALVSSQDYYAAANSDGTGTDYTSTLSVSVTAFAEAAVCSLYNGTGNVAYLSRFQIRGYPILSGGDLRAISDDSSSQALYGLSGRTYEGLLIANLDHLKSFSKVLLDAKAQPERLTDVTLSNSFGTILGVDVGQPIAIVNSLTGVNSFWYVNRISHDIDMTAGLQHRATFNTDFYFGTNLSSMAAAAFNLTAPISSYLTRSSTLAGVADGKKGIFNAWVRSAPGAVSYMLLSSINSAGLAVWNIRASDTLVSVAHTQSGAALGALSLTTSNNLTLTNSKWNHILAAWDLEQGKAQLYVNDEKPPLATETKVNTTLTYTPPLWGIGHDADPALSTFIYRGTVADLYFNTAEYLDIDYTLNRRKFVSSTGRPVDLGANGSTPTGSAPAIYLRLAAGATNANSFGRNLGTGGDFTVSGSLGVSSLSPSDWIG